MKWNTSFYSIEELKQTGLKNVGHNVQISRYARLYSPASIEIGNNVRIDDFCILSGKIILHDHIHISAYSALYGKFGIEMEDFTGLSPRCTIFSASDDFSGDFMIGPLIPADYTNIQGGKVTIKKFVQVGAGSFIMPGVTFNEGSVVGAMSFVKEDIEAWSVYAGNPLHYIRERSKKMLSLYDKFLKNG